MTKEELLRKFETTVVIYHSKDDLLKFQKIIDTYGLDFHDGCIDQYGDDLAYKVIQYNAYPDYFVLNSGTGTNYEIDISEFLSWFEESAPVSDKPALQPYVAEQLEYLTHKDWLLARQVQLEAHKRKFNNVLNKELTAIDNELSCDKAFVKPSGEYSIGSPLNSDQLEVVSNWHQRMESPHE